MLRQSSFDEALGINLRGFQGALAPWRGLRGCPLENLSFSRAAVGGARGDLSSYKTRFVAWGPATARVARGQSPSSTHLYNAPLTFALCP